MKILIVKHGALGDVVRTSYFAKSIKLKFPSCSLDWFTASMSVPLIESNPFIDNIIVDPNQIMSVRYDLIYSLDDEINIIRAVMNATTQKIVGAYLEESKVRYTSDVSEWFDMGIHSIYGLETADQLKKDNKKSHGEIFCKIFNVDTVEPNIYFNKDESFGFAHDNAEKVIIGINSFAGGRWQSKQLPAPQLIELIRLIINGDCENKFRIVLLGQGDDYRVNADIVSSGNFSPEVVFAVDTSGSLSKFMNLIGGLDYMITSDSLAMHIAIAESVKTVAFFSPTSANEIDDFGRCIKVKSRLADYCNYKSNNDNSDITASRIYEALTHYFDH